jgi:hypothetical protein
VVGALAGLAALAGTAYYLKGRAAAQAAAAADGGGAAGAGGYNANVMPAGAGMMAAPSAAASDIGSQASGPMYRV